MSKIKKLKQILLDGDYDMDQTLKFQMEQAGLFNKALNLSVYRRYGSSPIGYLASERFYSDGDKLLGHLNNPLVLGNVRFCYLEHFGTRDYVASDIVRCPTIVDAIWHLTKAIEYTGDNRNIYLEDIEAVDELDLDGVFIKEDQNCNVTYIELLTGS